MKDKKISELEKRIEELENFREESKLSESALWENEKKYRTLFESLPDGLLHMVDIIIDCNEQACKIFGREKDEIIGYLLSDFSPQTQPDGENSREAVKKILDQSFKDTTKKFDWLFLKKDGSKIYCEVCLNRIFIGGEDILQAIIRDVTERRNFIEQLKSKNQELENINIKLKEIVKTSKKVILRSKLNEIGKDILSEIADKMIADGGSIFLVKEGGLVLLGSIDKGHTPEKIPFPLREGSIFERVLSSKTPVLINDISKEKDFISSGWQHYKNGSIMAHPLFDEKDEIIGIISIHNKQTPPFTQVDLELTSIVISNTWNNILDRHRV
ncbi:PAS domain S-box protein [candidate division WOR-3 bacterium]|nr:PAS domain S-box protein [candidate division WOR-3 bacterium]